MLLSALVRARFAESLGACIQHDGADLFLVGLLSMMDAILEIPMSAVIEGLPLDETRDSYCLSTTEVWQASSNLFPKLKREHGGWWLNRVRS